MSEIPGKKVLKETLMNLKAKIIYAQQGYLALSTSFYQSLTDNTKTLLEGYNKMPEGEAKDQTLMLLSLLQSWHQSINLLNTTVANLIVDMNIYIGSLEGYSTELDNTLTVIFEKAREKAREIAQEQEKRNLSTMFA